MRHQHSWIELAFYPTKQQELLLEFYMAALTTLRSQWLEERKTTETNYTKQSRDIKNIRQKPMFKHVPSYLMRGTLWSLEKSIKSKGKASRVPSTQVRALEFSNQGWKITDEGIKTTKLGVLKVRGSLPSIADKLSIKFIAGRWYVYVRVSNQLRVVQSEELDSTRAVGVDLGVSDWLFLSNGNHFPQHKSLPVLRARLEKHTKSAERKEAGSPRHKEALRRIQKTQKRIENAQRDRAIKIAHWLCERWDVICLEAINEDGAGIKNDDIYKKACRDARWDLVTEAILKEASKTGVEVVLTPAWYTSQTCSSCDKYSPKSLGVRQHECSHCGFTSSRDKNAAINIQKRGLLIFKGERKFHSDWTPRGKTPAWRAKLS